MSEHSAAKSITSSTTGARSTTTSDSSPRLRPFGAPTLILDLASFSTSNTPPEIAKALLELAISPTLSLDISAVDVSPHTEALINGSAINHKLYYRQKSKDVQLPSGATAGGASVSNSLLLLPVGTKVATSGGSSAVIGAGRGELGADVVRKSVQASLQRMGLDQSGSMRPDRDPDLRWLIAQRPDIGVSYEEVAGGFSGLVGEGITQEWGVRDFPLRDIRGLLNTCQRYGYTKPTIYQGEYNALCRPSDEMFKLLRAHGVRFQAYAPTAWGALDGLIIEDGNTQGELNPLNNTSTNTSSLSSPSSQHREGAQRGKTSVSTTAWRGRFDTPSAREAVKLIRQAARNSCQSINGGSDGTDSITSASSVGLRWLAYHSNLGDSDGILLAVKSPHDLEAKLASIAQGPLPEELVCAMAEAGRLMLK